MEEKPKVELGRMTIESLEELVIRDILMTADTPHFLVHLAEKCKPIYKRHEPTYQKHRIDYSEMSGEKNLLDIDDAIISAGSRGGEKESWEDKLRGRVFKWSYPDRNRKAEILLNQFTEDVLSLTGISKRSIKERMKLIGREILGVKPEGEEGEAD